LNKMVADGFEYGLGAKWNNGPVARPGAIAKDTIARVRESLLWHAQIGGWGEPEITVNNNFGGHNPMYEVTYQFDGTTIRQWVMVAPVNDSPIVRDLVRSLATGALPAKHSAKRRRRSDEHKPQHFGLVTRIDAKGEGSKVVDTLMDELLANGWT